MENHNTMSVSEADVRRIEVEKWLAIRRAAGQHIDAETAETTWRWGQVLNPYGVYDGLSEEEDVIGRIYFARDPEVNIWVSFYDLPTEIRNKLWLKPEPTFTDAAWTF